MSIYVYKKKLGILQTDFAKKQSSHLTKYAAFCSSAKTVVGLPTGLPFLHPLAKTVIGLTDGLCLTCLIGLLFSSLFT